MSITIIVEGKNDRSRLRRLLAPEVDILCTFGTLNTLKLESLRRTVGDGEVYLYMDNDSSGKKSAAYCAMPFPMRCICIPGGVMPVSKALLTSTASPSSKKPGLRNIFSIRSRSATTSWLRSIVQHQKRLAGPP